VTDAAVPLIEPLSASPIAAVHTGQPLERVSNDMERDYFMTPEEGGNTGSSTGCSRIAEAS
jgi:hypothetical protein